MEDQKAIIVCTDKRGVFFGYVPNNTDLNQLLEEGATVRLLSARMAVMWTSAERGVLGLAAAGPGPKCRIGPAATAITVRGVHAVLEVSEAAVALWESEPWG